MSKILNRALLTLSLIVLCLSSKISNASPNYDEELFMPVGAYFKMDTQSDVHYAVVDGTAKVVLSERGKEVYLYKLGKVIVQASYYINGDYKLPYQRRYLLNVIPLDVYQEAQKDNFERVKLNPNATYVEVDRDFAEKILMLVNKERTQRGLRAIRLSTDLQSGAAIRAKELTIFYDHTRPNGEPCYTVINKKGRGVGENIAAGQRSAEEVMESWMNSTGHRRNILDQQFKELGVGYILKEDDANGYRHYWVQIFRG
ncbi:MAG: CAP domain-containing protein [Phascolarctobacterium sp.]|nr:CAP domain-containing protein [Phascolarctobacterium sp.]